MHILCPHCRNPIEVVKLNPREEITCPSCGSSLHLETESTTNWQRAAGQNLGKYELLATVGQGAFGTVYKARDPELDRGIAISRGMARPVETEERALLGKLPDAQVAAKLGRTAGAVRHKRNLAGIPPVKDGRRR